MFNIEEFDIKLSTDIIGRNFVYTEEIDSTNKALMSSKEFTKDGTVLLSEYQTAGKGRKSRVWYSNAGQNLTFSILLARQLKSEQLNLINLSASIAIASSLENLFQLNTNLKWPNDVLINNKKIAGILLESSVIGNQIEKIIVGIGINVNQYSFTGSSEFITPPTSVKNEFKKDVSRERILSEILNNFEQLLNLISKNPSHIIETWKSKSKLLGENVRIIEGDEVKFGKFEDLDENGFMILKMGNKTEKIHFGDVSLRQQ